MDFWRLFGLIFWYFRLHGKNLTARGVNANFFGVFRSGLRDINGSEALSSFDHFLVLAGLPGRHPVFCLPMRTTQNFRAALARYIGPGGNLQSIQNSRVAGPWIVPVTGFVCGEFPDVPAAIRAHAMLRYQILFQITRLPLSLRAVHD
jgi:hypothetical protein